MKKVFYNVETFEWEELLSFEIQNGIFTKINSKRNEDFEDVSEYILPGFIDAHIHAMEDPYQTTSNEDIQNENFDILWKRAINNLHDALNSGVTTVKDLGGRFFLSIDIKNKIKECNFDLPNFLTSGCYFSRKGGHCENRGAVLINNTEEFRKHILFLKKNKVEFVKILNDKQVFFEEELTKMIDIAHEYGMLVSVHAFHNETALCAVKSGADILEHAANYSDELLALIKTKDIIIVPTFVSAYDSCYNSNEGLDDDITDDLLLDWYKSEYKVITKLFNKNIKVALGSDCGFVGTPCNSVIREIQLLNNHFNISVEKLLESAFITTAQTINKKKEIGLIKEGYIADFVCYEKNPLLDLSILNNPSKVFLKGKEITLAKIEYKLLTEENAPQLIEYLSNPFFDCGNIDDYWNIEELKAWFNNVNDVCVGAFIDNTLIGFLLTHIQLEVNKVHLENIFVIEKYRNHGVAHKLFSFMKEKYLKKIRKIRFIGLVNETNKKALNLLKKEKMLIGDKMVWVQLNIDKSDDY